MATVKEADIASAFLDELGAPDTGPMRLAVIAWLRMESGGHVIGGNPWNMRPGSDDAQYRSGTRTSINGNGVFSVYPDAITGAKVAAIRLKAAGHDWRGYDKIVSAARAGNPINFLNALAASAWDAGRYGTKNGGRNKLLIVYAGLGGNGGTVTDTPPMPDTSTDNMLNAWGDIVSFPVGHVLTEQDVNDIVDKLDKAGFFNAGNGIFESGTADNIAKQITRQILMRHVGEQWNKSLQDTLQKEFQQSAKEATASPLAAANALTSLAGTVGDIGAALLDPRKWLLILALLAGAAMTAYGSINVLRAAA